MCLLFTLAHSVSPVLPCLCVAKLACVKAWCVYQARGVAPVIIDRRRSTFDQALEFTQLSFAAFIIQHSADYIHPTKPGVTHVTSVFIQLKLLNILSLPVGYRQLV